MATDLDNAYTYDGLSQVTGNALGVLDTSTGTITPVPAQTEAWNYDPTSNWDNYTTTASGTVTLDQTRIYDQGNRLMQIESDPNPIVVDRVGRMLEVPPDATGDWAQSLTLVWDAWGRIVQASQNGTVLGSYTYDGLTRRVTRAVSGVAWHCYYSDAWRPLEERQETQTTAATQYLWGARHRDDLVRRDRATTSGGALAETRYVLMDCFSPAAITDQTGEVTERYAFTAFGTRDVLAPDFSPRSSSECAWAFSFHGQFRDPENNLLNYGFRYYSATLGRWLCKDPIEEQGGVNIFCYVNNNPTGRVDFLGLFGPVIITCTLWKRCGSNCVYECNCPSGYTLGFDSLFTTQPCSFAPPVRTCINSVLWYGGLALVVASAIPILISISAPLTAPALL